MKRILIVAGCIMVTVCMVLCKKSKQANNAACTTCSTTPVEHSLDADSVFYVVPTAFTPNGDGINDIFKVIYNKLDTDSSLVTIWNINGTEVFTGKITARWEGTDLNGNKCPAGQYPVQVKLRTLAGITTTSCACVTLLTYSGSCIKTNGITYLFVDQIDPSQGMIYSTTEEQLCP